MVGHFSSYRIINKNDELNSFANKFVSIKPLSLVKTRKSLGGPHFAAKELYFGTMLVFAA